MALGDAAMTHPHLTPMQRDRNESDLRYLRRKMTDSAANRMRERTAKEQLAAAIADGQRDQDATVPDADDQSAWAGVMR